MEDFLGIIFHDYRSHHWVSVTHHKKEEVQQSSVNEHSVAAGWKSGTTYLLTNIIADKRVRLARGLLWLDLYSHYSGETLFFGILSYLINFV